MLAGSGGGDRGAAARAVLADDGRVRSVGQRVPTTAYEIRSDPGQPAVYHLPDLTDIVIIASLVKDVEVINTGIGRAIATKRSTEAERATGWLWRENRARVGEGGERGGEWKWKE